MFYWMCFFVAVLTEITGTLSMKYAIMTDGTLGMSIMYIMITCSYICLAIAIKRIPLGVAYAIWEGIGGFFITVFSVFFFKEPMNVIKLTGLLVLLAGIILVKSGEKKSLLKLTRHVKKEGRHHAKR